MTTDRAPRLPADPVGRRVAVRRRLPDGRLADVVGIVLAADDSGLLIRDRAGARHSLAVADLVAVTVPPTGAGLTPPRRRRAVDATVDELVAAQASAWQPGETVPLGQWRLRTSGGFTERANSALAIGDPGLPVPAALAAVAAHYRQRSLPPRLMIVDPLDTGVDEAAAAAGWSPGTEVLVMVADLPDLLDSTPRGPGEVDAATVPSVGLAAAPDVDWLGLARYEGREIPDHAIALLRRGEPTFATAVIDGVAVGVARGTCHDGWLGLTAMTVAAEHRRRGVGTALLSELTRWAAAGGARWAWLQVAAGNATARRLYAGAGFAEHHRYHYRVAP